MSKIVIFLLFLLVNISNCSTGYSASDMLSLMNQYLDTHAIKSYYMTLDPDNLLDEIDHKLLAKYQNIIFDKYNIVTLVIVARGLTDYGNGLTSFINQFYKEFNKTFKFQDLRCIISIITVRDYKMIMDSTKKIKYIFNDNVLGALLDKMKETLNQNHLFLTIYELLKNIEKAQKQFIEKGAVTDL